MDNMITKVKAILSKYNAKAGFTVTTHTNNRGDIQVVINRGAQLFLRLWSFEPEFEFDLTRGMEYAAELKSDVELEEIEQASRAERLRIEAEHYLTHAFDGKETFSKSEIQQEINVIKAERLLSKAIRPLADASIKVTTRAGASFTARISEVIISDGALTCNNWLMRLNLIENRAYCATIVPAMIDKWEIIQ